MKSNRESKLKKILKTGLLIFFILVELGSCFFLVKNIRDEYFSSRDKPGTEVSQIINISEV